MDYSDSDIRSLCERVARLESQNMRARRMCLLLLLVPVIAAVACVSRSASIVEAQRFVLRDSSGKMRAEITMQPDILGKAHPVVRTFDENGKEKASLNDGELLLGENEGEKARQTMIGPTFLTMHDKDGSEVALFPRYLQITKPGFGNDAVRLDDSSLSMLGGESGASILLDTERSVLEIQDSDGFRATLGRNDLVNQSTGEKQTTSAATLMLFRKNKTIIWSTPR